jgi:L-ascorbate metabolism protein UlaG (beta-lactamase superfamily)
MKVSKFIHSCLLLEKGDDKLLFDPGAFSFAEGLVDPGEFREISAIILTHFHPDHIDDKSLKIITGNNPDAVLLANAEIAEKLGENGFEVEEFSEGAWEIGEFTLAAFDAKHADILNSEPPENTAYIVDGTLLIPGDSYGPSVQKRVGIPVLALPVMAPWTTELETASIAVKMGPKKVIPIHDGYAKDFFLKMRYDNFRKYFERYDIEFIPLSGVGDSVEIA